MRRATCSASLALIVFSAHSASAAGDGARLVEIYSE